MSEGIIDFDRETGQVILRQEDGRESRFYIECEIEVEQKKYIVLIPAEEYMADEEEEVTGVVFEIGEDADGEQLWIAVEDEETLQKIESAMEEREKE